MLFKIITLKLIFPSLSNNQAAVKSLFFSVALLLIRAAPSKPFPTSPTPRCAFTLSHSPFHEENEIMWISVSRERGSRKIYEYRTLGGNIFVYYKVTYSQQNFPKLYTDRAGKNPTPLSHICHKGKEKPDMMCTFPYSILGL